MEQARFIYIELGRMVSFDEEYWFGNTTTRKRIYTSAQRVKGFKDISSNKVICVSLSNLYNSLMNKIGIEAVQQQETDEDPHVYSIININGINYIADLQRDLKYIQAKRKTMFFGKEARLEDENSLTEDQLMQIDHKIGYLYDGEQELKSLISLLKRKVDFAENLEEKIEIILSTLGEYQDILHMGYVEKMGYYESIMKKVLTQKEKNKTFKNDMYVEDDEKRKYTCCISVQRQNGKYSRAIYSEKTGTFLRIEDEKIIELMENGLKMLRGQKIPGLNRKKVKENMEQEGQNKG